MVAVRMHDVARVPTRQQGTQVGTLCELFAPFSLITDCAPFKRKEPPHNFVSAWCSEDPIVPNGLPVCFTGLPSPPCEIAIAQRQKSACASTNLTSCHRSP
jgi:hypothetical protein